MRRDGIIGIPKGLLFGLTSIFVKPVSGILDFVSSISGSLANNILDSYKKTFVDLKNRRRHRILWGSSKYVILI